ncbi:MAG: twin-arginine translocase TatA/TatE family subunit [Aquihabitans sp.]
MNLGPTELIVILVIVLLLFGGAKLPQLARSLGEAKKEFEKGTEDGNKKAVVEAKADNSANDAADKGPIS